jgi:hypothetical protein
MGEITEGGLSFVALAKKEGQNSEVHPMRWRLSLSHGVNQKSKCKITVQKSKIPRFVPQLRLRRTSVENVLQIGPFYAKQSQFSKKSNGCKFNYNKGL